MSPICTGCLNVNELTATVATRPRATRLATVPPAMSTCDMIHPPKMSPFWFASAGIGTTRSAGPRVLGSRRPRGWCDALPMVGRLLLVLREVVQRAAPERRKSGAEDQAGVDQVCIGDDSVL